MRVRKKHWAADELTNNQFFIEEPMRYKGIWHSHFNNNNPLHIEIGCGKGTFINDISQQNPYINYIGLEKQTNIVAMALRKANKTLENISFICGDAASLLDLFAPTEIQRIYINFCDPWPKKKWAKRRLTHKNYLDRYKILFATEGKIMLKTDNQNLFEFSLNQFAENNFKLSNITFDLHKSNFTQNITTEYEQKFMAKGLPIYRCEAYWKNTFDTII